MRLQDRGLQGLSDSGLLGGAIRSSQAAAAAILVHRTASKDGQNLLTFSSFSTVQDDYSAAFASDVAVSGGINGFAAAVSRQHAGLLKHCSSGGGQQDADSAYQASRDLVGANVSQDQVSCH